MTSQDWHKLTRHIISTAAALLTAVLAAAAAPQAGMTVHASSSDMKIYAIDIGWQTYGDATYLVSGGRGLLMDTGDKDPDRTLMKWLANNKITSFDMYLSHYHDDHDYYMAEIIRTYNVGTLYLPENGYMSRGQGTYMDFHRNLMNQTINAANARGTKIVWLSKGSTFTVGNAKAEVLWGCTYNNGIYDTKYINNNSLLTRFTGGGISFLTGGDLEAPAERAILDAGIDIHADLFKMNHHGGNTSNTDAFVKRVDPVFAWFNSDSENGWAPGWQSWSVGNINNTANVLGTRYNGTIRFDCYSGWVTAQASRHTMNVHERVSPKSGGKDSVWHYCLSTASQIHMQNKLIPTSRYSYRQSSSSGGSFPGTWIASGDTWWYRASDGSWAGDTWVYDKGWYFLNSKGYVVKGWKYLDGNWFYFDPKVGVMYSNKWAAVNGKWYFFDKNGVMKTGWIYSNKKWYYLDTNGAMKTGWANVNGKWYYLGSDGAMRTGWLQYGQDWYFLKADGSMAVGWLGKDPKMYYMDPDSGAMKTGLQKIEDSLYYFGTTAQGYRTLNAFFTSPEGDTYYFGPEGKALTGLNEVNGSKYYFDPLRDGAMVKGFVTENGHIYCFDEKGIARSGWFSADGKQYYADPSTSEILTGKQTIDGIEYVFDENGALLPSETGAESDAETEETPDAQVIPEELTPENTEEESAVEQETETADPEESVAGTESDAPPAGDENSEAEDTEPQEQNEAAAPAEPDLTEEENDEEQEAEMTSEEETPEEEKNDEPVE